MTIPPSYPDTGKSAERAGVPRWVWLSGIAAAVVILAVLAVMFLGGGHNPRPHGPGDNPPETVGPAEDGHVRPPHQLANP